jgi:hypothetical protein
MQLYFVNAALLILPFGYAERNLRILYASVSATNPGLRKCRFLFDDLLVNMCRWNALCLFTFPVAVSLNVLWALRWVFIFGMDYSDVLISVASFV